MKPKASIIVMQFDNPRYDCIREEDDGNNCKWVYRVIEATNTLVVHVDQKLHRADLQMHIDNGINVKIVSSKKE